VLGVVLGGCGGSSLPDESTITGLHFTTSSEFSDNPQPNVDVTLSDPSPARVIYAATVDLPEFPSGTYHCPADLGFRHSIVFLHDDQPTVTATLNTGGCRDATISTAPPVRQTDDVYWAIVAKNLGVDEATLFETAEQ